VNAVGFLDLGHVFVAHKTGNTVLLELATYPASWGMR
jgi:uncharacterized membrane protein YoaK (UPF0700 family)